MTKLHALAMLSCLFFCLSGSSAQSMRRPYFDHLHFDHLFEMPRPVARDRRGLTEVAEASDTDRQALVDLYYSTNGEGWTDNTNWISGDPCVNEWYEITCDEQGGVAEVVMAQNYMTGVLNESICDLFALQRLQLQYGKIGGVIPSSIGNLKNVTLLVITDHEFEGIPASVGNMTKQESFSGTTIGWRGASRSSHIAMN